MTKDEIIQKCKNLLVSDKVNFLRILSDYHQIS